MIEKLDFYQGLLSGNKYYIIPGLITLLFFLLQIKNKRHFEWPGSLSNTFTIFSITLSTEYVLIFLFFGILPQQLAITDKVLITTGVIFAFMSIIGYCLKDTGISNPPFMNKKILNEVKIQPVSDSSFNEELVELEDSLKLLKSPNSEDNKVGFWKFVTTVEEF